jgi:thiamine biosynthesis lipoprotein
MAELISETRLMWDMPITVAIVRSEETRQAEPRQTANQEVGGANQEVGGANQEVGGANQEVGGANQEVGGANREVGGANWEKELIASVFDYFEYIDEKFSTYKPLSEISLINQGALGIEDASADMQAVFARAEEIRQETNGYFNITRDGKIDPLGLVKGWALSNAADRLRQAGCENFYVEAGGDFQAVGLNAEGMPWRVGIRSPFNTGEIVKVLAIRDRGVATSGTYIRGQHITNPVTGRVADPEILSITVIGPDVYEADCYATAALAMGRQGIGFIESLEGFEGYMIDTDRQATFTSGFERYVNHENH